MLTPNSQLIPPPYSIIFFKIFFLMRIILKGLIKFVTSLFLCHVSVFWGVRHAGSSLPNQGLNPHPLHWKKS